MRHRARTTIAGTVATDLACLNTMVGARAAVVPGRIRPERRDCLEDGPAGRVTTEAARCAARCTTAEPGRRGERPPRFWAAVTGAFARRRPPVTGGRSPLRPGSVFPRTRRATLPLIQPRMSGHHASDCRTALGSVNARRQAPPARCAAGGLDGALRAARTGSCVMARGAACVPIHRHRADPS